MRRSNIIIVGLLLGGLAAYFFIRRKKLNDKQFVFKQVAKKFGKPIATNVERIYRLETGHFLKGFDNVYGAGMHPSKGTFPYGWNSLKMFWLNYPQYKPSGVVGKKEGKGLLGDGGGEKLYLKFPNFMAGAMTVAKRMQLVGNNPGAWFSSQPDRQISYNNAIGKITPEYVNNIS